MPNTQSFDRYVIFLRIWSVYYQRIASQTLDAFPQYLLEPLVGIIEQRELLKKLIENANGLASDLKQEIDDIADSMKHIEHAKDESHGQQDEQLFESLLEELKAAEGISFPTSWNWPPDNC